MRFNRSLLVASVVLGASAAFSFAGDPAERQKEVDRLRADAAQTSKQAAQYNQHLESPSPELKAAAQALIAAIEAKAAATTKLAAALSGTDEKAVKEAREESNKTGDQVRRSLDRLEVRKWLVKYASMDTMIKAAPESDKSRADSLKAAIAKANTAGEALHGLLGDAGKNWPEIDAARDAWNESQDNVDIEQKSLSYAIDRARMTSKLDFSNAEVKAKLDALTKTEEEAVAAYRLSKEKARQAILLDRKRQAQTRELLSAPKAEKPVEKPAAKPAEKPAAKP